MRLHGNLEHETLTATVEVAPGKRRPHKQRGSKMGKPTEPYDLVWVESYEAERTSGLHGKVHIRPIADTRRISALGALTRSKEIILSGPSSISG